jgi:hypothetical protein
MRLFKILLIYSRENLEEKNSKGKEEILKNEEKWQYVNLALVK